MTINITSLILQVNRIIASFFQIREILILVGLLIDKRKTERIGSYVFQIVLFIEVDLRLPIEKYCLNAPKH